MLETRKCWGEAFAWIRDYLGDNAPMTSEAGHDQLIGYLDGADCQHLQITPVSERFCNKVVCKDWERVPWFDAVLHDKFSLHGVGYSGRYQGGRERREHGIESDDYISAEILEGHALMIDRGAFGRGAVRKYWLAQDFVRSIALDQVENVEFVAGDIHRQIITWKSGARVIVNRGDEDWMIAGKRLPQYGYFAKNGPIESSIEKIDNVIVEQSCTLSSGYFNVRDLNQDKLINFSPVATNGAFRCERKKDRIILTPLPDSDSFTIRISVGNVKVKSVVAVDGNDETIRDVEYESEGQSVTFQTRSKEFAYHVLLAER
jgi:hypothetical protein